MTFMYIFYSLSSYIFYQITKCFNIFMNVASFEVVQKRSKQYNEDIQYFKPTNITL